MAEQYFTANPESAHEMRSFQVDMDGKCLTFETDAGVFSKQHIDPGSELLCRAMEGISGDVLDMGCGWGAMSILTMARFPEVHMTMAEINERAIELARVNVKANGMQATAISSDGFANVEGQFDVIMTNPPIRAGKSVIYGMFADAREHLKPGGALWLVIRKQQGAESAAKYLRELYAKVELVKKKSGYHVYCCSVDP